MTLTTTGLTLADMFPPDDLTAAITAGHVIRKQHPTLPLSIYTYTRSAQYDRAWTTVTTRCRGLVAEDVTGRIVALPFEKFFNVGEHDSGMPYAPPLPDLPFEVFDKMDGSLGIVFHYDGHWCAASKGSFISDQAQWAQTWLDGCDTSGLQPGWTYLAEIIYPENRIVVNYGNRCDLVLLAAIDPIGEEAPLKAQQGAWGPIGSVVEHWPAMPLAELLERTSGNVRLDGQPATGTDAEGYVLRFANGVRAKAKLAEYVRLHKILTGITERDIWRYLGIERFAGIDAKKVGQALGMGVAEVTVLQAAEKAPLDALLEQVPDEFDQWARSVAVRLAAAAEVMAGVIYDQYQQLADLGEDRAVFARAAQQIENSTVRAAMFFLLDGKPVDLQIWRSLKPVASDPFKTDEDN